jgi:hypothetical protein
MKFKFFERSPLYIFLLSIYPVLFLLSVNLGEAAIIDALRSGLIFLLAGTLLFLFMLIFTRNAQRSAFYGLVDLLLFLLIFFVLYAPIYRALRTVPFGDNVLGRHRILVPATAVMLLLVAVCLLIFGRRIPRKILNNCSIFLNLIAILLTVIPLVTIITKSIHNSRELAQSGSNLPTVDALTVNPSQQPDVYYIILDMMTNENALKQLMEYDGSGFTQALEERGFFVSQCSRSNYDSTQLSLASSLNLDYLQDLNLPTEPAALYPAYQQNRVLRMLRGAGYSFYTFESGYAFTEIKDADTYSTPTGGALSILTYPGVTNFESLILSISAGQVLYENRTELTKQMQTIIDAPYTLRRAEILNVLDSLPEIAAESGPKFIFAHVLAPHDPFVFNEVGEPAYRRTPFTQNADPEFGAGYGWGTYTHGYAEETAYLQDRVVEMIDQIFSASDTPPVIIIQGDHGIPRSAIQNGQFEIFNAYYFPGIKDTGLYDTISPVNSFRLVFNHYFGTAYDLLPDRSYDKDKNGNLTLFIEEFPCP